MRVRDLVRAMESIAPPALAESWDRVGLHVGHANADLTGAILLTIDLTEAVVEEAVAAKASAVVAYHPPIWQPISRLTGSTRTQRVVMSLLEHGIAVYSPHTALDAAGGGVTDWLCEGLSGVPNVHEAGDCRALSPHEDHEPPRVKIVTFVPEDHAEQVRNAMATAGAGLIGDYRVCSFASPGVGTFLGGEGTNPAVGEAGRLERVQELRLEMIADASAAALVCDTLRRFHPYEEPAIDLIPLTPEPRRAVGAGRRLVLDTPATAHELAERLRGHLDKSRLKFALPEGVSTEHKITTVGVCPGAGGELAAAARAEGCELFVTGEMKHHEVLAAMDNGMGVLLAGHTNTERGYLPRLADRLRGELVGVEVMVCERDMDPLTYV
ncbi:MAG: Nif3-like dinuclear metal center hexameric protein [Planctomycetota bacterium]